METATSAREPSPYVSLTAGLLGAILVIEYAISTGLQNRFPHLIVSALLLSMAIGHWEDTEIYGSVLCIAPWLTHIELLVYSLMYRIASNTGIGASTPF